MQGKLPSQSRTLTLNLAVGIISALAVVIEVILAAGPTITLTTALTGILAGLNYWLRWQTSAPIITGPVQQIGGTQTNIGSVASSADTFVGSSNTTTAASGGAAPFPPPGSDSGVGTV